MKSLHFLNIHSSNPFVVFLATEPDSSISIGRLPYVQTGRPVCYSITKFPGWAQLMLKTPNR